ncbi:DNA polymerase IV [Phycicoccus endophyticus]|uniref:DNA polymerase IV n=1 Tax=Phycicoccus endophyticus TaxID=1690220 RepID=A0A7G9R106_9MICO|nr:DNA polymerase IV [Phycicoccus endophyticus]NHI20595.1 DNA polymerase IV [Phycicoccus endophyticus]QNN49281.1 DNA polymerase IV [Phycicoccus endophyticus]GGL44789.1 DNA polymerase IV [Phycicoccus endophyticus]
MRARPVILHLDLDAFFTAVEQLHKPSLRGKPVVVGGVGGRGVVSTASYEARAFGIRSAMPMAEARRRCPNAAFLSPRFEAYRDCSHAVMDLARELTPLLEQVSIDEAYLDLTPALPTADAEAVAELAAGLRSRIRGRTGLTASVGAGTSKLVAKIHSDLAKPDGLLVVPAGEEADRLAPLPVRTIPGVGPATAARLAAHGVTTVGRLATLDLGEVVALLGSAHGRQLHAFAQGLDDREVVTERAAKSVSAESTFPTDVTDRLRLEQHVRRLTSRVGQRLRADGLSGRTVVLKARRYDFSTLTRSVTLDQPTDDDAVVLRHAQRLLAGLDVAGGLRLLGVGVSGLSLYTQPDLLDGLLEQATPARRARPGTPAAESEEEDVDGGFVRPDAGGGPSEPPPDDPSPGEPPPEEPVGRAAWRPGQDVEHAAHGRGWVQGSGVGRVTVRFEGPHTEVGRVRTFAEDDPELLPAEPPQWRPQDEPAGTG